MLMDKNLKEIFHLSIIWEMKSNKKQQASYIYATSYPFI
jgi:hypothetical protein